MTCWEKLRPHLRVCLPAFLRACPASAPSCSLLSVCASVTRWRRDGWGWWHGGLALAPRPPPALRIWAVSNCESLPTPGTIANKCRSPVPCPEGKIRRKTSKAARWQLLPCPPPSAATSFWRHSYRRRRSLRLCRETPGPPWALDTVRGTRTHEPTHFSRSNSSRTLISQGRQPRHAAFAASHNFLPSYLIFTAKTKRLSLSVRLSLSSALSPLR